MRKGFTLVELLIVIVIIGILAAAMLLSSGSATASATASTIVSDLRSLKTAALMHWADSMDTYTTEPSAKPTLSLIKVYMDNPEKITTQNFGISVAGDKKWWVYAKVGEQTPEVREKLKGKAKTTGLMVSMNLTAGEYAGGSNAYLVAR